MKRDEVQPDSGELMRLFERFDEDASIENYIALRRFAPGFERKFTGSPGSTLSKRLAMISNKLD
jgi:hypothetical protein